MITETKNFTVYELWAYENIFNTDPDYQREGGIWNMERKQLFIDSIINGFDIPKLYIHDIRTQTSEPERYNVVDGKQRITTILQFLKNDFPLSEDFKYESGPNLQNLNNSTEPLAGNYWNDINDQWKHHIHQKKLDFVAISNADKGDIEELFLRLNNGESLNAAEKRNSIPSDMNEIIRDVSQNHSFFTSYLALENKRYNYYELSAKFIALIMEATNSSSKADIDDNIYRQDLKKKHLDKLVNDNKFMEVEKKTEITQLINRELKLLTEIFEEKDELLAKISFPPLFFIFAKTLLKLYVIPDKKIIREFLKNFELNRTDPENEEEIEIVTYNEKSRSGSNDIGNLNERRKILSSYFLKANPNISIKAKRRNFTNQERRHIYFRDGQKCIICNVDFSSLAEMDADHILRYSDGGPTALKNARSTCQTCNRNNKNNS